MNWQSFFRVAIRLVFLFAYIAFLAASIRHIATFFHNFEADPSDWGNPYTLAVSIDLTSLILTVGVMFFRTNMPWHAQAFTWIFIIALTGFSWFVNWEYARTYQGTSLHTDNILTMLNPILASSFAFLNLAYSVVAEFFSSKNETAQELATKIDELEQLEGQQRRLAEYKQRTKQPSLIQRTKETALEARAAIDEVLGKASNEDDMHDDMGVISPSNEVQITPVRSGVPVDCEGQYDGDMERLTDSVSSVISGPNALHITLDTDPLVMEGSASYVQNIRGDLPLNEDIYEDDMSVISLPNDDSYESDASSKNERDRGSRRGGYAITKEAAAHKYGCQIKDINAAISSGIIKPFAKDDEKVLVSSLTNFNPPKRRRKITKKLPELAQ